MARGPKASRVSSPLQVLKVRHSASEVCPASMPGPTSGAAFVTCLFEAPAKSAVSFARVGRLTSSVLFIKMWLKALSLLHDASYSARMLLVSSSYAEMVILSLF